MKRILLVFAVLFAAAVPRADAHAFLDHADPKVGSTVATAPGTVKLTFTEDLEPAFSTVRVLDAKGAQMDKKDAHLDAKNKSILVVSLSELPAGTYTVIWRVVSKDTHTTQGDFKFTVGAVK